MLDNHVYNLMTQIVQEHKSLWRIKRNYRKDAKNCKDCKKFWAKALKDKEKNINEMLKLLKKALK